MEAGGYGDVVVGVYRCTRCVRVSNESTQNTKTSMKCYSLILSDLIFKIFRRRRQASEDDLQSRIGILNLGQVKKGQYFHMSKSTIKISN
jgi:hypothetical protein